jgi:hypothetical protein
LWESDANAHRHAKPNPDCYRHSNSNH